MNCSTKILFFSFLLFLGEYHELVAMRVAPIPVYPLNFAHCKELFDEQKEFTFFKIKQCLLYYQERGQLVHLDLSDTDLYVLPWDLFEGINNIFELDISYNHFIQIPSTLCYLARSLTILNISHNNLSSIHELTTERFGGLRHLDASCNTIDAIFLTPDMLPLLIAADFSNNNIRLVTPELRALCQRAAVNLSHNPLS